MGQNKKQRSLKKKIMKQTRKPIKRSETGNHYNHYPRGTGCLVLQSKSKYTGSKKIGNMRKIFSD